MYFANIFPFGMICKKKKNQVYQNNDKSNELKSLNLKTFKNPIFTS